MIARFGRAFLFFAHAKRLGSAFIVLTHSRITLDSSPPQGVFLLPNGSFSVTARAAAAEKPAPVLCLKKKERPVQLNR
ncbi:MAG: hypothetical protein L0Y36_08450, partial [Planctomycetales bacterium]|nr:hypothetical protein [Planctomycetales bacterium]